MPEEGDAQLRGYYALESNWGALEAQVQRGTDAQIVIVDSELNEREESRTPGPGAVATLGEGYGTADADSDGELDGLPLYTYQDSDPAGTWRGIFMADDNGGVHSPKWRTHEPVRMLTANQVKKPRFSVYGWGSGQLQGAAENARTEILATEDFDEYEHAWPPTNPKDVRTGISQSRVVYLNGHGSYYPAGVGTNHHHGDTIITRDDSWPIPEPLRVHHGISSTTAVALRYHTNNDFYTCAMIPDGSQYWVDGTRLKDREGWSGWQRHCQLLVAGSCWSAHSSESFARRVRAGNAASDVVGYTRAMQESLNAVFMRKFWEHFAQENWQRFPWRPKIKNCYDGALIDFWAEYNNPLTAAEKVLFDQCVDEFGNGLAYNGTFTYLSP